MEQKSSIYKQSGMQKQEDQSTRRNQSGIAIEPVSINRKETWQKEINRNNKTSGIQVRNKVYVCILSK